MSEKLYEDGFITVDINAIYGSAASTTTVSEPAETETSEDTSGLPGPGEWKKWKEEYDRRLVNGKAAGKSSNEIENEFFKDFFNTNWETDVVPKLLALGDPLKTAIIKLGFIPKKVPGGNPILAFVRQRWVIEHLLKTDLLNANTFKAIFNAVAKRLVADSEFFKANSYNIIYCPDLYRKIPTDMVEYLTIQSQILEVSVDAYPENTVLKNRQVFLDVPAVKEADPTKRAKQIKALPSNKIPLVTKAKLNSIKLAKVIAEGGTEQKFHLNNTELDKLVSKLPRKSDIVAMLLSLCSSTKSAKARKAIKSVDFTSISPDELASAFVNISSANLLQIERGHLKESDADILVDKLLAALSSHEERRS